MEHLKIGGLAVVAVAASIAFAGTASATVLTSPAGTEYTGTLTATASGSLLLKAGFANITCTASTMSGKVEVNTTAASGKISSLSYSNCGSSTVDVLKNGSLEIVSAGGGEGSVYGSGSEVTVSVLGTSCVYGPGLRRFLGKLISTLGKTIIVLTAVTQVISGGFACANPAEWTGEYTVTTPSTLLVD